MTKITKERIVERLNFWQGKLQDIIEEIEWNKNNETYILDQTEKWYTELDRWETKHG